jgi:hypothetical protein
MRNLALVLVAAIALSVFAAAQPLSSSSAGVVDVSAYGSSLFLALENGLVTSQDASLKWNLSTAYYGFPVHLEAAPRYGLLVLTDRAWLGLLTFDGRSLWLRLAVDPNLIKPGTSGIIYANGTSLIYAGKSALLVSLPKLEIIWTRDILNKYTDYSLSPAGDAVVLVGFNTFCSICIMNEEKLVTVRNLKNGKILIEGVIQHLKTASVLWRRNWLVLVQWDAVKVYDLNTGALNTTLKVYTPPQPHDKWLSYGFSPSGELFYYTCPDGERLGVYVLDVERGISRYTVTPIPAGKKVLSQLADNWKLAVVSYDASAGAAYCALLDALTGEVRTETISPASPNIMLKLLGNTASIIVDRSLTTIPNQLAPETKVVEAATFSVTVKVIDDSGAPLQGALVCANSTCATTALDGAATLKLAQGRYTIVATHPSAETYKGTLIVSSNVTIPLVLTRFFTLTVKGVLENGITPPTCIFTLVKSSDRAWNTTAPNCTADFLVPRGSYTVVMQFDDQRIEQNVELKENTLLLVRLREETVKLTVEAVNRSGAPVANATITVFSDSGEALASLDGGGTITVKPGRYFIRVEAPGYLNWSSAVKVYGDARLQAVLEPSPKPCQPQSTMLQELVGAVALSGAVAVLAVLLSMRLHALSRVRSFASTRLSRLKSAFGATPRAKEKDVESKG